jgi:broad specificity phosphatase PhoE
MAVAGVTLHGPGRINNAPMGTIYLVRHGQASFGADDYDQLSDLGHRQCERLGHWFAERGLRFDRVLTGTLKRHRQSLAALEQGLGLAHEAIAKPALDEYDSHAVIRLVHDRPLVKPTTSEDIKQHFRWLREGLLQWMDGRAQPQGMPPFADFRDGIASALRELQTHSPSGNSLVVSSGGPIATALGTVLGLAPAAIVELNLFLRNSAICELRTTPQRLSLITFNHLPHLDDPSLASWVTHA